MNPVGSYALDNHLETVVSDGRGGYIAIEHDGITSPLTWDGGSNLFAFGQKAVLSGGGITWLPSNTVWHTINNTNTTAKDIVSDKGFLSDIEGMISGFGISPTVLLIGAAVLGVMLFSGHSSKYGR